MLKVGLTGSIAVGKTTVCNEFRRLGCYVIDADHTARDVVRRGTPGLAMLAAEFGPGIIGSDGELDRAALAAIVFDDEKARLRLNSIVHPLVIEAQDEWLRRTAERDPEGIAIVDAALMIESGGYRRFDKLIVVWCEPDVQLRRLMERDGLSRSDALKRIQAQMPQEEKKKYADILIDTSAGIEETRSQVAAAHRRLKSTAD